jgi:serine/threonine-protein kinase RsbW
MAEPLQTVVVSSSREGMRRVVNDFEAFFATHGLSVDTTWPLLVALDEVLSNVLRHGYGGREGEGRIEVAFSLRDGVIELTVADDAGPFDPLALPDPDTTRPVEDRPLGGLGILFVKQLMDEVAYERREGRNRLTCRKKVGG